MSQNSRSGRFTVAAEIRSKSLLAGWALIILENILSSQPQHFLGFAGFSPIFLPPKKTTWEFTPTPHQFSRHLAARDL
ncbi:MAG: hypothetical protein GXY83_38010 [Rhodopirellula sp.]|nr:hypothetical protein [Rhodopirellula sp.]